MKRSLIIAVASLIASPCIVALISAAEGPRLGPAERSDGQEPRPKLELKTLHGQVVDLNRYMIAARSPAPIAHAAGAVPPERTAQPAPEAANIEASSPIGLIESTGSPV